MSFKRLKFYLLGLVFLTNSVLALYVEPYLSTGVGYNDNIDLVSTDNTTDSFLSLSTGVDFSQQLNPDLELQLYTDYTTDVFTDSDNGKFSDYSIDVGLLNNIFYNLEGRIFYGMNNYRDLIVSENNYSSNYIEPGITLYLSDKLNLGTSLYNSQTVDEDSKDYYEQIAFFIKGDLLDSLSVKCKYYVLNNNSSDTEDRYSGDKYYFFSRYYIDDFQDILVSFKRTNKHYTESVLSRRDRLSSITAAYTAAFNDNSELVFKWENTVNKSTDRKEDYANNIYQVALNFNFEFDQAYPDASSYIEYHLGVAQDYLVVKEYDLAEKELKKVLLWSPDNATAHYELGGLYYLEEKYTASLAAFNKVLDLDPEWYDVYYYLSYNYYFLNLPEKSLQMLEILYEKTNDDAVKKIIEKMNTEVIVSPSGQILEP